MKHVPIHFLPAKVLGVRQSKRESELEISKAKSHTSRVSYPRKAHKPGTNVIGNYIALTKSVNNDKLDPFIQLVVDLSDEDRNWLHLYLKTKPLTVYGTSDDSIFCPVRDCAIPHFKTNAIYIQWHILLVETSDAARYARRANIYAQMRELVNDQDTWKLDSTIFTLSAAAICENRSGTELGRSHLTAVVRLMQLRNGLRTIQEMSLETGITVFCALVMWEKDLIVETITVSRGREVSPRLKPYFQPGRHQGVLLKAHLACLHCMNGILERVEGSDFLQDLENTLQQTMPTYTVLCGIGYSARKLGYWESEVMRMGEAIEFVDVVFKMEQVDWVVEAMSSWLTGTSEVGVQEVVEKVQDHMTGGIQTTDFVL